EKDNKKLKEEYIFPKKIEKEQNLTYNEIKPINFNLKYTFNNNLINTLKFKPDVSSDSELDSFQKLFTSKFDIKKNIERFYLNEDLTFRLNGSLQLLNFGSNSLYQMSPVLEVRYVKWYDSNDFYDEYLKENYGEIPKTIPKATFDNLLNQLNDVNDRNFLNTIYTLSSTTYFIKSGLSVYEESQLIEIFRKVGFENPDIKSRKELLEKSNRSKSEFKIYYNDTITNDLSFNQPIFAGTNIVTSIGIDIFKFNEQTVENYIKLNELNSNNPKYQFVDPVYYFNRITYEKIQKLNTRFNFNVSPLPQDSNHKLTISLSSSVNYIIPQDVIGKMKETLWNKYKTDVHYVDNTTDLEPFAKEYLYYRTNGENIYENINSFFKDENFWNGAKYFRKIFTDIRLSFNYSYKMKSVNLVEIRNDLEFKLENIGAFSNGKITQITDNTDDRDILPLMVYPNNSFNLNLFNNVFTYNMSINFISEIDINFANYQKLKVEQQALDEFKIMKMVNSHKFGLNLDGKLFPIKLPKGSWFRFSSNTDFWYSKNQKWNTNRDNNGFFLYSQNFSLSLLMDILTVSLSFKAFDFVDRGYGLELDSGSIKLGYNVTEIPIFWNYFKLNINPAISFDFVVKHKDYYEGTNLYQYNTNYYSSNKLTHSLSIDLSIGQGTDFETIIRFSTRSENSEMYKFFKDDGVKLFFEDIEKSFNFADIRIRKESSFKLKEISVSITHKIHDWFLSFSYRGFPEKNSITNRFNWDNVFTFSVEWKLESENQLMKMFNKTKLNGSYSKGEWQQPVVSLDAEKN
ncbi:MAG TPA: hypothetical protein PK771_01715, partial [Spirochaetota bacterium]|nr:hypothetical protein [Spirochaetota bacterium]